MSTTPTPVTLVGATGLTGKATFLALLHSSHPFALATLTRKPLPAPTPAPSTSTSTPTSTATATATSPSSSYSSAGSYTNKVYADLFTATSETVAQPGGVYVSCLGTTRAAAGSFEAQQKIDVVLNTELAAKAKQDGAKHLILVSSGGASATSRMPYFKMKGVLEENVIKLGFEGCVILKPGLLLGPREEWRTAEWVSRKIFGGLRVLGAPVDSACIDVVDIGKCIAYLAANPPTEPVTILTNSQIIATAGLYKGELGPSA